MALPSVGVCYRMFAKRILPQCHGLMGIRYLCCALQGRHWVSIFEIDRWDSGILGCRSASSRHPQFDKEGESLPARYWFASPLSVRSGLSVWSSSSIASRCESLLSTDCFYLHGKLHLVFRKFMPAQSAQLLTHSERLYQRGGLARGPCTFVLRCDRVWLHPRQLHLR